jgi:hypothetical protein
MNPRANEGVSGEKINNKSTKDEECSQKYNRFLI